MTGSSGWERRIGERHEVPSPAVGWNVAGGAVTELATLLDLSVSGASVLARPDPSLSVGDTVEVDYAGARGQVSIRRIAPAATDGQQVYAIEFVDSDPSLAQAFYELLKTPESEHLHEVWDGRWVD